ncbi:MAG: P-II family nitrogen regulator [Ruminiclostridium sp.]
MVLIRAIVRPEKSAEVMEALADEGFPAVTKLDVFGRGKQKGIQAGGVVYDELPKDLLMIVCEDCNKDKIISIIMKSARTDQGNPGDGRIFVMPVEEAYTISTGEAGL